MKKCPTCDKTFDDGKKFCQIDGTPLVEVSDAESQDPFKTMVGGSDEIASAIPIDPFKTMVAPPIKKEEKDVLELPEEPDFLKTMVSSPQDVKKSKSVSEEKDEEKIPPPSSSDSAVKLESPGDKAAFGSESSLADDALPQTESRYSAADENPFGLPIPSPFEESMIGYDAPSKPLPSFDGSESFQMGEKDSFQSPFNQPPSPLREAEIKAEAFNTPYAEQVERQYDQPMQQANWTPPPAPDASWQNQEIGQNTPFQPPPAGQAQNQTLAIVSLVCGILGLFCCWSVIPGIAAVVTGFMAKNKADQNPNEYGGRGLALGGIITGGISLLLGAVVIVVQLLFGVLGGLLGNI